MREMNLSYEEEYGLTRSTGKKRPKSEPVRNFVCEA